MTWRTWRNQGPTDIDTEHHDQLVSIDSLPRGSCETDINDDPVPVGVAHSHDYDSGAHKSIGKQPEHDASKKTLPPTVVETLDDANSPLENTSHRT